MKAKEPIKVRAWIRPPTHKNSTNKLKHRMPGGRLGKRLLYSPDSNVELVRWLKWPDLVNTAFTGKAHVVNSSIWKLISIPPKLKSSMEFCPQILLINKAQFLLCLPVSTARLAGKYQWVSVQSWAHNAEVIEMKGCSAHEMKDPADPSSQRIECWFN